MRPKTDDDGLPRRQYVTAAEAAAFLGVHWRTVHRYAAEGLLTPHHVAGTRAVRFLKGEVRGLVRPADGGDHRKREGKS